MQQRKETAEKPEHRAATARLSSALLDNTPSADGPAMQVVSRGRNPDAVIAEALALLEERAKYGDALTSPAAVRDWLRLRLARSEREEFVCIFLSAQHRVIELEVLFQGTLTQTSVYPREVVRAALKHNAAAVILAHNHPSGVAEPSQADQVLTETLQRALALVDVKVLDHVVVGGAVVVSFAARGLL